MAAPFLFIFAYKIKVITKYLKIMKINRFFMLLAAVALMPVFCSCGSPKPVTKGMTEVSVPLSSKKHHSDSKYFRATGMGESPDLVVAKKIALMNARTEIASTVQATIKTVSQQYLNQVTVANKQEYMSKFEETSRQVVNQVLEGVTIQEEKIFQAKKGPYQYYVNLEMSKDAVVKGVADAISKDQKLYLEFEKEKFQKVFDEEMAKFENQ